MAGTSFSVGASCLFFALQLVGVSRFLWAFVVMISDDHDAHQIELGQSVQSRLLWCQFLAWSVKFLGVLFGLICAAL